ncbi:multiple epidermal growth factor-like domains protein 6 isoform X2 [Pomacea canaliculata]|uniref:multiple epidermal growth factor-like domains protein 6 isoform X2 n=1 Tax=Pomacea canaliculata TaxID=400727 RepID=UPI000D72D795|nr:multiple epidermal growth factor-like domains protein 6 isoform X2 [Pomacea canaliculata]
MCSSSKGCVWWWIAALSVLVEILVFTAAQNVNVQSGHERNVARGRPCNQSSVWKKKYGVCGGAINGRKEKYTSNDENTNCIHTDAGDPRPWWTVYLAPNIYIHKINIFSRSDNKERMAKVSIYLDERLYDKIKDCDATNCKVEYTCIFKTTQVQKAQSVTLANYETNPESLNICEVEVFACQSDRYGLNCEKICDSRCKPLDVTCDRLTGSCIECKNNDVWDDICDQPCSEECKRQDVTCNRSTGACIECPDGKWGDNCTDVCGAGCEETNCHLNGTCTCRSHWMPPKCDVCKHGKWGEDCLNDCGEGCEDGKCDMTNGHCKCKTEELVAPLCGGCNPGKWGKNCENDCGAGCEGETCNKDDGTCNCLPGWGKSGTQCDGRPCECGEECTTSRKYIFADVSRKVNVAIGKPSKASTIKKVDNDDSCLANDGYLSTSELTTCMSTAEGDPAPFWEVDLEEKYELAGISIDFDNDDKMKRSGISILLDGKEIFVTNDETPDPVYIPNNKRRKWTGQVLKLRRKGRRTDPLMICEVEVFNCMPGFYGYECEGICEKPVCDNGKFCSRIDGSCKETVEVKETTDCSPLILVAGYVVGFLIISLFIFAAKVIPYKKKPKREAVKKEAEGDKVEGKSEGDKEEEGAESGGDKQEESQAESGETSETREK